MYPTTVDDVRAIAYGLTIPTDADTDRQIWALLDQATLIVDGHLPDLARRAETDAALTARAGMVISKMVLRVLRNPRGLRSIGIDDLTATIDTTASSGELYLAPDEAALLTAPARAGGGVGSIRLGIPPERLPRAR